MPLRNNVQDIGDIDSRISTVEKSLYYKFIFSHLSGASSLYPGFHNWFFNRVVPGIELGERQLLIEGRNNHVAGIAIVKTGCEKKLCTLRVSEQFQNKGLGIKLFESCFEALDTCKPLLTVSEEKFPEFQRIFDYYGFEITSVRKDLYRKGKNEFFFNEY